MDWGDWWAVACPFARLSFRIAASLRRKTTLNFVVVFLTSKRDLYQRDNLRIPSANGLRRRKLEATSIPGRPNPGRPLFILREGKGMQIFSFGLLWLGRK